MEETGLVAVPSPGHHRAGSGSVFCSLPSLGPWLKPRHLATPLCRTSNARLHHSLNILRSGSLISCYHWRDFSVSNKVLLKP